MGVSYGFDHGLSAIFVYGEDAFDEIWPKIKECINDPRWHYGETQMLLSLIGRKFAVLSWEEIQVGVDALVEKVKPIQVALPDVFSVTQSSSSWESRLRSKPPAAT